tara:strand:- start:3343 stop:3711 length:369 start_codon:yes stop_codon:yes gene_type:complete
MHSQAIKAHKHIGLMPDNHAHVANSVRWSGFARSKKNKNGHFLTFTSRLRWLNYIHRRQQMKNSFETLKALVDNFVDSPPLADERYVTILVESIHSAMLINCDGKDKYLDLIDRVIACFPGY